MKNSSPSFFNLSRIWSISQSVSQTEPSGFVNFKVPYLSLSIPIFCCVHADQAQALKNVPTGNVPVRKQLPMRPRHADIIWTFGGYDDDSQGCCPQISCSPSSSWISMLILVYLWLSEPPNRIFHSTIHMINRTYRQQLSRMIPTAIVCRNVPWHVLNAFWADPNPNPSSRPRPNCCPYK